MKSKAVLLTVPAYTAASILSNDQQQPQITITTKEERVEGLRTKLIDSLKKIYYPPIVGVWTVYPDEAFKLKLDGFGHLIPRTTNIRTLGSIWATTLFQVPLFPLLTSAAQCLNLLVRIEHQKERIFL